MDIQQSKNSFSLWVDKMGFASGPYSTKELKENFFRVLEEYDLEITSLREEVERLKGELKIADDRWKTAEHHHKLQHESEMNICDSFDYFQSELSAYRQAIEELREMKDVELGKTLSGKEHGEHWIKQRDAILSTLDAKLGNV